MFIPGGWHHVVVNMDLTVAVTQNFCSRTNFTQVWPRMAVERPKLSFAFRAALARCHPELAALADSIKVDVAARRRGSVSSSSGSDSEHGESELDGGVGRPVGSSASPARPGPAAASARPRASKRSRHG